MTTSTRLIISNSLGLLLRQLSGKGPKNTISCEQISQIRCIIDVIHLNLNSDSGSGRVGAILLISEWMKSSQNIDVLNLFSSLEQGLKQNLAISGEYNSPFILCFRFIIVR